MKRSLVFALVLFLVVAIAGSLAADAPPPLFYAVVSDTQKPDDDPFADFARIVDHLNGLDPEFVLTPGDLTDTATENQYRNFMAAAEKLESPTLFCVGNHDAVCGEEVYRERFTQYTGAEPWYHETVHGWHIIVLDSVRFVDGKLAHDGVVSDEQLRWLEETLAGVGAEEPIILAMHHPISVRDDGLQNADDVLAAFEGHSLLYTITAHFHRKRHDLGDDGIHHFINGAVAFSTAPEECGTGYSLVSTVGNDLWAAWVGQEDEPGLQCLAHAGTGGHLAGALQIKFPQYGDLPRGLPESSRLAVRIAYMGAGPTIVIGTEGRIRLPDTPGPVTALLVLSDEQMAAARAGAGHSILVSAQRAGTLMDVVLYSTSLDWEHHELRPVRPGAG